MGTNNDKEAKALKKKTVEQCDIDNVTMEVLETSLGKSFEARIHAEKAYKEKHYELQSTQVYVQELEDELEEEFFKSKESLRMSSNEDFEEDYEENEDKYWKQYFKRDV